MSDSVELYGISAAVLVTVLVVAWIAITDRMRIPEERFPRRDDGSVNLDLYTKSADHYWAMYNDYLGYVHGGDRQQKPRLASLFHSSDGTRAFSQGAHAIHGMVACGPDSVPYAIELLTRPDVAERDTGALILRRIANPAVVEDHLIAALDLEFGKARGDADEPEYVDALVDVIDDFAGMKCVPILVQIVQESRINLDTRYHCIAILGRITNQNFNASPDPIQSVVAWHVSCPANANTQINHD